MNHEEVKKENASGAKYRLEEKVVRLKELCQVIDPYSDITIEDREALASFGIIEWRDPYHLTNQLVFTLENHIEELMKVEEAKNKLDKNVQ